jgi:aminoglycoside phosphotransferase (APT) family kinase protein
MPETQQPRPGEELNIGNLRGYLIDFLPGFSGDLSVEQFAAGSSNLTYLLKTGINEFVLRRPPFGSTVKSAHDMNREFRILEKLSPVYPPAPKPVLHCADESVIGSEFFIMECRRGLVLRRNSQPDMSPSAEEICGAFIKNLTGLHSIDYKKAGIEGKPEGYIRRHVEGWTKRYFDARTSENNALEAAIKWINANIPVENTAALIHNDYKFDNVILDPNDLTKIVAVLDWEMATVGDPLTDLGTTLGYWCDASAPKELFYAGFNPPELMKHVSRSDLAEMYAAESGRDISNILYFYVYGLVKIAVIAQQIYFRYVQGFTRDERFAAFEFHVKTLGNFAAASIDNGTI